MSVWGYSKKFQLKVFKNYLRIYIWNFLWHSPVSEDEIDLAIYDQHSSIILISSYIKMINIFDT